MRIFVLVANYELRLSRKSHLRDHPSPATVLPGKSHGKNFYAIF
jgi:hypothetical protein